MASRASSSGYCGSAYGSLRFGRGKGTPEIIARELGFEVDDVLKMLDDLKQAGFDLTPTRDR
jgi:hypothetical protein